MKLVQKSFIFFSIAILFLAGCNENDHKNKTKKESINKPAAAAQTVEKKQNNEEQLIVDPLPTTYEELANKEVGKYADINPVNQDSKVLEIFKDLPDISGTPDNKKLDDYYNQLLKMVQKNYEGPEEAIRNLKFQSLGDPNIEDSRYQFKDHLNVEIILDASGSMGQLINGKTKMNIAKDSILSFVNGLPKDAKVGLRVYGHKGSGSDSDKQLSCSSSEKVYDISNLNESEFKKALNKFSPKGWTPIGLALSQANSDLAKYDGKDNTNIVYLVSDGVDTCNDEPIQAAKNLYNSNISPIINVIGFNVDSAGQNQLKQIADATKGIYEDVNDESDLQKELQKINDVTKQWKVWKEKGKEQIEIKKIDNDLNIFGYVTDEHAKASDEGINISLILSILYNNGKFNKDSYDYLINRNQDYHQWVRNEIDKFNQDLRALNEKSYSEALKVLEDKYNANTQ